MLNLNINETKPLTFEIQLSGINPDVLTGYLRFEIGDVEYGFPVEFGNENISVSIPPLKNIVNKELKEGEVLNGKLEVNGNGHFMNPWSGEFKIVNPVKMEATIQDKDASKVVSEAPEISVSKVVAEKVVAEKKEKYAKPKQPVVESKPTIPSFPSKPKKRHLLENVTTEDIYKYMSYVGTKNKKIQQIVYETCEEKAGTGNSKDIFKEVYHYLKKQ